MYFDGYKLSTYGANLFLYCYERNFIDSFIEALSSIFRYFGDLLNTDNLYFEGIVYRIESVVIFGI